MKFLAAFVLVLGVVTLAVLHMGDSLVVNHPEKSDVILVLAGDHDDHRYWHGLELLHEGFGQRMTMDVPAGTIYGHSFAEHAANFVASTAGDQKSQIALCTIVSDSTVEESAEVAACLSQTYPKLQSVLVVTNDFHTRRALSIFRTRLPQYHWSVAAVMDPSRFGQPCWSRREWAKTCIYEWEKLVWWELFESWRK